MRHVLYLETPAQISEICAITREHLVTRHLWDAYRQHVVVLMRQRSAKTEKIYRTKRRNLVRSLLSERPVCQRCNADRSHDVHEKKAEHVVVPSQMWRIWWHFVDHVTPG
jgi:uncharacterized protein with PIN domain